MSELWESKHRELGYETEFNMFHDLYIEQHMSLRELKAVLGVGVNTIRDHMQACGIKRRPRGGKNRLGMSRIRALPDEVFEKIEESSAVFHFHPSALYKEKRRRKEERERASQSGSSPEVPGTDLVGE